MPPPQLPGQVAEQALIRQLRPSDGRQLAKVQVRDVGEPEHEETPIDALPLLGNRRFILGRYDGGKRYRRLRGPGCTLRTNLRCRRVSF